METIRILLPTNVQDSSENSNFHHLTDSDSIVESPSLNRSSPTAVAMNSLRLEEPSLYNTVNGRSSGRNCCNENTLSSPHFTDDKINEYITHNFKQLNEIRKLLEEIAPLARIHYLKENKLRYDTELTLLSDKNTHLIQALKGHIQVTIIRSLLRELEKNLITLHDNIETDLKDANEAILEFEKECQDIQTAFLTMQQEPSCRCVQSLFEYQRDVFDIGRSLEGSRELFFCFLRGQSALHDFRALRECLNFDLKRRRIQDLKTRCDHVFNALQTPKQEKT